MELPKTYVIQSQVDFPMGEGCVIRFFNDTPEKGVVNDHVHAAVLNDREEGIARLGILAGYMTRRETAGTPSQLLVNVVGREPKEHITTIHLALREITPDPLGLGAVAVVLPIYLTAPQGMPWSITIGKLNTNPAGHPLLTV